MATTRSTFQPRLFVCHHYLCPGEHRIQTNSCIAGFSIAATIVPSGEVKGEKAIVTMVVSGGSPPMNEHEWMFMFEGSEVKLTATQSQGPFYASAPVVRHCVLSINSSKSQSLVNAFKSGCCYERKLRFNPSLPNSILANHSQSQF